uniref:non-specific serine/threonine protein kinase n=1 Tax=Oryza brachyantha TaxID=4533 RepID=J3MID6_ORYBR
MVYQALHPFIFFNVFVQVRQTSHRKFCFLFFLVSFGANCTSFTTSSDDQLLYHGFTSANLITDDTTIVMSNGLLELTNGTVNRKGHAFYPSPLHFHRSHSETVQSFSVSFVFAIHSSYPGMSLHGLAFVVSPSTNFSNALASQYLGFLNSQNRGNSSNHILAIEFDTVMNIEFEDINNNHVGIDINNIHSVKSHSAGYYDDRTSSFRDISLISGDPMQAWVDYNGEDKKISVALAPIKMEKPTRPLISISYDLSTVLKEPSYIGFSASTGSADSRHYILGWSFGMNKPAPTIIVNKLPKLPRRQGSNPQLKLLAITLPIASAIFVILLCGVFIIIVRRRLRYAELKEDWEDEFGPHQFSYKDLLQATQGFSNKQLLGAGGFGKVYKGVLPSSKLEVAVKRVTHESRQGMKEFVAEVVSIGHIRHRNIVQLLGYCRRKGELLLVYDYMTNGSLDKYLYYSDLKPTLSWDQRFRIIKGIASGLLYLHDKWEKAVIHRDIKASNVLLDSQMNGRLGDFGLARLYDHGSDLQTTHVVGTMGYLAPELVCTGKASPLTDVFAFGTFLLEVTCGQRPVNNSAQDNPRVLVDWVVEHWQKGLLTNIIDTRLQGKYNIDEACSVLKLGLLCSHPFTSIRPNMQQVMQYLDGDMLLPELTHMEMSFSMLSIMQDEGFNPLTLSYPPSGTSIGTISNISGGR